MILKSSKAIYCNHKVLRLPHFTVTIKKTFLLMDGEEIAKWKIFCFELEPDKWPFITEPALILSANFTISLWATLTTYW